MSYIYFIGQGCAILAWILLLISYHTKRENMVIFFQMLSSVLYIVNYMCLGATTGLFISIFELIKSIGYYKTDKDNYIYFFTLPVYIVIIYFSGLNLLTILAVLGSLIDGFVLLKSKKTMVYGGIISYLLWFIYDIYFMDIAGGISDLFVVISNLSIVLIGYSKYLHRSNIYTVKSLRVSKNTIKTIDKLDKANLDKEYRWDIDKVSELTKDKKYSYILVKDENKVVGYINFLNLTEEVYNKMLESNEIYDSFEVSDISDYTKNRKIYLNLNSIVLLDEYNNSDTIKKIEDAIKRHIKKMRKNRYYIQELCCFSVNYLENKVLEDLEFNEEKKITNECSLYRKVLD